MDAKNNARGLWSKYHNLTPQATYMTPVPTPSPTATPTTLDSSTAYQSRIEGKINMMQRVILEQLKATLKQSKYLQQHWTIIGEVMHITS